VAGLSEPGVSGCPVAADEWRLFLTCLIEDTDGSALSAAPHLALAHEVEQDGDVASYAALVDTALAADPGWPPVLVEAAELAEVRGDAATARDLLWRIGESLLPTQTRLAQHFADPPIPSGAGRNRPCGCGSGRKAKACCGALQAHPLPARASWLWSKV
jgi:hypothetical protein